MFGQKDGKPVDVIVVEAMKIDGEHAPAGTVIKQMAADQAMELAASGRLRAYTEPAAAKKAKE